MKSEMIRRVAGTEVYQLEIDARISSKMCFGEEVKECISWCGSQYRMAVVLSHLRS